MMISGAKSNGPETPGEKLFKSLDMSLELRLLPLTPIKSDKYVPWTFNYLAGLINYI